MRVAPMIVGVALLLVLAGCAGPIDGGDSATTDTSAASGSATATDGSPSATDADGTTSPPSDLSADNPFGQAVVPVRVNDTVADGRDTRALVAASIAYWNDRIDRFTPYDYRFVLADDPADARLEVRFVEDIGACGRDHDVRTVGCAPLFEPDSTAPDVAVARVELGRSNSAVVGTIEHELGHILGLRHDDEPLLIMGAEAETPVTDATERAVPWYRTELSVYVDYDSLTGDRETLERQFGHALAYYNDGAEGTIPDNVTYTETDHRPSADVVITNDERYECGGLENAWGMLRKGPARIDTDDAIEVYTSQVICVDVDADAFAWVVGKGLGRGMGLSEDELAPPLQDDSYENTHSEWWE